MAPADGEDEKYYFRESMSLEKQKKKEKDTIILL